MFWRYCFADSFTTNYDTFIKQVQIDQETFTPPGIKINEYTMDHDNAEESSVVYEMYRVRFFAAYFLLLFISVHTKHQDF